MKNAASFNIRPAREEDLDLILKIRENGVRNAFAACTDIPDTVNELVAELANPETVKIDLEDPEVYVLVAVDEDDDIVGTAKLKLDEDAGELCSCFCEVRGQGMGQQFIEERMKIAASLGLEKVWFETDTINPGGMAHAKKNGFREVASRPGKRVPNNFVIRYEKEL